MLNLGHILISDLVVTNLFMHSLPDMNIATLLGHTFLHEIVIHTYVYMYTYIHTFIWLYISLLY